MSKQCAATLLVLLLTAGLLTGQEDRSSETIRVDTRLVSVPVIVSDRNDRYIPGMRSSDFTVFQDGVRQDIEFFAATEEPLTIALLIDTSHSTRPVLGDIKDSARSFIKLLTPADRAMIVSFDNETRILSPLTSDQEQLRRAIKSAEIPQDFGTTLRDAAYQTVRRTFAGLKGRKAIILLTDGKDAGSSISRNDLLFALQESDTLIYTVMFTTGPPQRRDPPRLPRGPGRGDIWNDPFPNRGGRFPGNDLPRYPGRRDDGRRNQRVERVNRQAEEFLKEMSQMTAGRFYSSGSGKLKDTFEAIVKELRYQYRLGFYPPVESAGPSLHQLKVKVSRPDAIVRARTGYRVKDDNP